MGAGRLGCSQWVAAVAGHAIITLCSWTVVTSDSPYLPHNFLLIWAWLSIYPGRFISSLIFASFDQPTSRFSSCHMRMYLSPEQWRLDEILHSDLKEKKKHHYGESRRFPFYHWNFVFDVSWSEGPNGDHDYNSVLNQSDWSRTKEISRAKQRLQENGSLWRKRGWPGVAKIKDEF